MNLISVKNTPSLQANEIRRVITCGLRNSTLSLYEAYLLHCEAVRIERIAYTQSAWRRRLSITGLLTIVMHGITAEAFGLDEVAKTYADWYAKDFSQLGEYRPHFLTAAYPGTTGWLKDHDFLHLLHTKRIEYDNLPDGEGPYPTEVFPFHFAAPERRLLGENTEEFRNDKRSVGDEVGDAIVELATGRWGMTNSRNDALLG